jgi:hypothetical protein
VICETCGTENLDTSLRCVRCSRDLVAQYRATGSRGIFSIKRAVFFLFVWLLLVGETIMYSGRVPNTAQGWVALLTLGPIAYVLFFGVFALLFRAKK